MGWQDAAPEEHEKAMQGQGNTTVDTISSDEKAKQLEDIKLMMSSPEETQKDMAHTPGSKLAAGITLGALAGGAAVPFLPAAMTAGTPAAEATTGGLYELAKTPGGSKLLEMAINAAKNQAGNIAKGVGLGGAVELGKHLFNIKHKD